MRSGALGTATALAVVTALFMTDGRVAGQLRPAGQPVPVITLPDGQPDIQGIWGGSAGGCSIETGMCPEFFNGRPGRPGAERAPRSVITIPADGKIPYQPWAAAQREQLAQQVDKPLSRRAIDSRVLCFNGPPRSMYTYAYRIIQTPGYVIFAWEWSHLYRVIPLNRGWTVPDDVKTLMGISRGRWEGKTLVVETRNLSDWGWFDDTGTFHSDGMGLLERFSIADGNRIEYKATITDPRVFTQPWTIELPITRRATLSLPMAAMEDARFTIPTDDPHASEPFEHACFEGERAAETMLGTAAH